MKILTECMVLDKNRKEGTGNFVGRIFYNIVLGEPKDLNGFTTWDTLEIGVPEEVFNKCVVGKVNRFGGSCGGYKTKFWKFDSHLGVVDKK